MRHAQQAIELSSPRLTRPRGLLYLPVRLANSHHPRPLRRRVNYYVKCNDFIGEFGLTVSCNLVFNALEPAYPDFLLAQLL